jgi:hypothetical protein
MMMCRQAARGKRLRLHRRLFCPLLGRSAKRSIAWLTFDMAAAVCIEVPAAITSSPFSSPATSRRQIRGGRRRWETGNVPAP